MERYVTVSMVVTGMDRVSQLRLALQKRPLLALTLHSAHPIFRARLSIPDLPQLRSIPMLKPRP